MTQPLSPIAQAVLNALTAFVPGVRTAQVGCKRARLAAAAIRALVEQTLPEEREPYVPDFPNSDQIEPYHEWLTRRDIRAAQLAVADELEGAG